MSDLGRACTFCGRHRSDVDGRMLTVRVAVPDKPADALPWPQVSICWACLSRPVSDLVSPLGVLL